MPSALSQVIHNELTRYGTKEDLSESIEQFIESGDSKPLATVQLTHDEWIYRRLAGALFDQAPNEPDLIKVYQFFVELAVVRPKNHLYSSFICGLFDTFIKLQEGCDPTLANQVHDLIASSRLDLPSFLHHYFERCYKYNQDFSLAPQPTPGAPFRELFINLIWQNLDETHAAEPSIFAEEPELLAAIATYRPAHLRTWIKSSSKLSDWELISAWKTIVEITKDYDPECLEFCKEFEQKKTGPVFQILFNLNEIREDEHLEQVIRLSKHRKCQLNPDAIQIGLTHLRSEVLANCLETIQSIQSPWLEHDYSSPEYRGLFELAFENWDTGGEDLFSCLIGGMADHNFVSQATYNQIPIKPLAHATFRNEILRRTGRTKGTSLIELWEAILASYQEVVKEDLWELLTSKSKSLRNLAANALASADHPSVLEKATEVSRGRTMDTRLGAIELLKQLGKSGIPALKAAHAAEKSQKVQGTIEEALASLGEAINTVEEELSTEDLLAQVESDRRIKLPKADWFDLSKFPLIQKDGTPLSEKAITFLIQKQAKHKTIDAAPGILPVLELLDREKNADSALDLLNQWLDSNQEAKDRWALVFAGLLGDNRVIPALTPRIQPWCENARHKLAEYAAQAISLLATEEALMILDTLANRYRSRFKNIGKACTAAFLAAAEARGVSADELGDLVVPNLGFNSECHKEFDEGKIVAVLQPDFKITWLNPETEKETKSPPSTLSAEGKEELKVLRKILREAVKGQTARLEQMLVRQRRWPVARWQELFEEHPLLQSYAASLVWGIYDSKNELLRTFRRYPNGILAHGSGEMEDLEERDTQIGIVHPLELNDDTITTWREHLGRFKINPHFPQLDRPVETLEKDHGNRREITFTENIQISGGTFLSRMNKRGWNRGSVIDAGGVTSYYKPFEGAGVEAILFLEEYWVGFDPMDSFPLGKALFAKLSTVDRGSYTYDDPQPNDPRVISFGEVPPIVYSETIADLKALIAGQEKS